MRNIPTDNLSYGLLISIQGGGSGSGYFVNTTEKTFLVTAKHVLFNDAGKLRGDITSVIGYTQDIEYDSIIEFEISLSQVDANKGIITNGKDDLALIFLGKRDEKMIVTLNKGIAIKGQPNGGFVGAPLEFLKPLKDVLVANDVYIIGYPSSVGLQNIPQIDYMKPLVRKGIVAGKNKKLNTIILDCEVYPGNSGGPVIEVEVENITYKYTLIGTISQYIPFALNVKDTNSKDLGYALNNSGYSVIVPCDPLIEMIKNHK